MGYERHPQYSFGPRHRIVTKVDRLGWWRVLATVLTFVALTLMLGFAIFGPTPAHAADDFPLRQRAEQLNSECRDASAMQQSCVLRDKLLRILAERGQCWNPKAGTPGQLWAPCRPSDVQERRATIHTLQVQYSEICNQLGHMAFLARAMAVQGKRPPETMQAVESLANRGVNTTQVMSPEALTFAAYTRWAGLPPGNAQTIAEGSCRLRSGLL